MGEQSIVFYGLAGQGVKFLSVALAKILKESGYHIALTNEYSSSVRAGESNAYIVFSKKKIENPIVEHPTMKYDLKDEKLQEDLIMLSGEKKFMAMVLLGRILKELNIKVSDGLLKKILPKRLLKENIDAIKKGYEE